ncbi:MAG: hypothetical protein EHM91_12835 [Planctomycetota bacterium]|nr:MAG: hypothetical protein EHM91_12835 [Planctomycetota bacterium]
MRNGAGIIAVLLLLTGASLDAQEKGKKAPSKKPVKEVMERSFKDKGALIFLVRDGESTEAQNKKLLEEFKALDGMQPPLGDVKGWKNRTGAAIAALQELVDKKPGAVERVRSVTDCTGCHNAHRVGGNK